METVNTLETPARSVDWKAVESDYRTSSRSTRAIGATHGVSHTAIQNRARAEGWTRPDESLPVKVESDAAAQTAAESSDPAPEPVTSADDDLSDAVLDCGARIQLTRKQAEGMAVSLRELAVCVTVAEADRHPDYCDAIAELKARRKSAILRHRAAAAQALAAVRAGQSAAERIETLRRERAGREADFPSLAVAFAMGNRDAAALAEHRRAVESMDDQLAAIKAAVPLLEVEARRIMNRTESIARAPEEIGQELANIRGAAACAIARSRW